VSPRVQCYLTSLYNYVITSRVKSYITPRVQSYLTSLYNYAIQTVQTVSPSLSPCIRPIRMSHDSSIRHVCTQCHDSFTWDIYTQWHDSFM